VIGQPPELAGSICEALVCESFVSNGEVVATANVVFLRFRGIWHRLCIDGGVIFWKMQDQTPAPWSVMDEGWTYPHVDVGSAAGVIGRRLDHYEMTANERGAQVELVFDHGRGIIIDNVDDRSDYRIV
jgi:hypothetical protein